jgi:2-polyprenyl-6-methoxyphenol hydroxylase-like FAD-dependent oxidoreductase
VGPDLHYADKAVLIGDVIHTVKPYFGIGVNSALNDVTVLGDKLEAHPVHCNMSMPPVCSCACYVLHALCTV